VDLDFSPGQDKFRRELREFLEANVPENWVGIWHHDWSAEWSSSITREMADRGWLTMHWPTEFGGRAASVWDQAVVQEELFARHEPRGGQYMGVNWIGPTLMRFGEPDQLRELLPEISSGAVQWAQLFSEPDAGSDLAGLRTRITRDGDGYVVNGEKIWTSYANTATRGFLLGRSDGAATRTKGLSVLLIDMGAPGVTVREIPSVVGDHRFHSVSFQDVRVPFDRLLGAEGQGWDVAMWALPFERAGNARYARTTRLLGLLERWSQDREDKARDSIVDAWVMGRTAELLNYASLDVVARGGTPSWQASTAFAFNARYETFVAGLWESSAGFLATVASADEHTLFGGEVESFAVCQAPTVKIQAGSYQVQLSIIAQAALGLQRSR
jgi:alkylation response protein AidB-like acyl-CoA dehydrogenase